MVYIVLGMHKSGTTLISEMLHKSGINMVESFNPDKDYDSGQKFERFSTQAINKNLLACGDIHSLKIPVNGDIKESIEKQEKKAAQTLVTENDKRFSNWGFKDPRTCLTYPFWKKIIPDHRIIVIYRHPAQVVNRYSSTMRPLKSLKAFNIWKNYNREIIDIIGKTDLPFIVLNYDDFMSSNDKIDKLENFVGQEITDTRKRNKYRNKSKKNFAVTLNNIFKKGEEGILSKLESFKI